MKSPNHQKEQEITNLQTFPLVSIVINNYNYASFLKAAIDSALLQSYSNVEVVVVDDGSTDVSHEVISKYGESIISVTKENGGQASALNAGFQSSSGAILCFLDADDIFYPNKVSEIVNLLNELEWHNKNVLLNNFLDVTDQDGTPLKIDLVNEILSSPGEWRFLKELAGRSVFFDGKLNLVSTPEQVYQFAAKYRFIPYLGVQTSGITMTRSLAKLVFPLPDKSVKISADVFMVNAASLYGKVYSTSYTLTQYRIHKNNNWYGVVRKNDFDVQKEFDKQKEFFLELNGFLNSVLNDIGKTAVFSYMDSMSAKGYYRYYFGNKSYKHLSELAFKVISWHINFTTIQFYIKTTLLAMWFRYKCFISTSKFK